MPRDFLRQGTGVGVTSPRLAGLLAVLRLARCVDAPKSQSDRRADEALGVAFSPRSAVEDPGTRTPAMEVMKSSMRQPGHLRQSAADSECWRSL